MFCVLCYTGFKIGKATLGVDMSGFFDGFCMLLYVVVILAYFGIGFARSCMHQGSRHKEAVSKTPQLMFTRTYTAQCIGITD